MATLYYGKDRAGNPVYESSSASKSATVTPSQAIAAPYSTSAGQSQAITTNAPSVIASGYNSPTAITAANLAPVTPINVPTPSPASNINTNAMTALGAQNTVAMTALQQQMSEQAAARDKASGNTTNMDFFNNFLATQSLIPEKPSALSSPEVTQAHDQMVAAQNQTNQDTALLNAIITKQNQDLISTRGAASANGVTEAVYGGIQNEINRNAALQSLPIAAKIAIDQGNLKLAQDNLTWMTSVVTEKITNAYDHAVNVYNSIKDYVTTTEARLLDEKKTKAANNFTLQRDATSQAADYAKLAIANGQGDIAEKLMTAQATIGNLNTSSPTYAADLQKAQNTVAALAGQLVNPMTALDIKGKQLANQKAQRDLARGGVNAPTVKTINGVDMQWNPSTAKWESIGGVGTAGADKTQNAIDQLSFLRTTAAEATKLSSAAGPSAITRSLGDIFIGDSKFRQLEAQTNTLRTNVLSLMTDPAIKKFFGPQMSDADVRLMTAAGTTLNPQNQSPTQMKTEIKRLDDIFIRMQNALGTGAKIEASGGFMVVAPDGTQVHITD